MTPLDWNTLACVTFDHEPFSSFSTMSLPCIVAHSMPPLTVFSDGTLKIMKHGDAWMLEDEKGGKATSTIPNVYQSNGVIHVIDTVVMPS